MNEYRQSVKRRMVMTILAAVAALALIIYGFVYTFGDQTPELTADDGMARGYPLGLATAGLIFLVIGVVKYSRALKNETALKKLYAAEKDERQRMIQQKAMQVTYKAMASALIAGSVIAGFYNIIVAQTLIAVTLFMGLSGSIAKLVLSKRY